VIVLSGEGVNWPDAKVVCLLMEIVSFHGVISWPVGSCISWRAAYVS
jgi:hypothetical protein